MTKSEEIIQEVKRGNANHYNPLSVVLSRADGVWVWDADGKKYMDMLACYSAVNLGHNNPKIRRAIERQLETGLLQCSNAFFNENQVFDSELADFCGFERVLVMNTGAEAVETFIKLARKWFVVGRGGAEQAAEIIVCENNFHGRTTTIVSFSSDESYRYGFGPHTQGFKIIPDGDLDALERAITSNTAAFLLEPIQGEGGVIIPPRGYLKKARELCHKNGVLFALDEIQTGFARTGKMFAWEHENARPDVLILGKSLGTALPISAVLASKEVMDAVYTPGTHGSTFANGPLPCAVGRAVLDFFRENSDLPDRVRDLGNWFMRKLRTIKSPYIQEVRGKGLFVGVELKPEAGGARRFAESLMNLEPVGILCKETHENVIRFVPPLIVTKEELEWAFENIKMVLETTK